MPTPEIKAAVAAMKRLSLEEQNMVQLAAVNNVIRALIEAHPDPESVKLKFEQFYGQTLASPAFIGHHDRSAILRGMAAMYFPK